MDLKIRIRPAKPEDAEKLLAIYAPYVEQTAITFEYEVPTVEEFRERIHNTLKKYPYLVAEQTGEPVGYAYVGPFHDRPAYDWAVETSIYVDQNKKRMGIGKKLHEALEEELRNRGFLNMNACIAYPNPQSIAFHEKMGYRAVGKFTDCAYKLEQWLGMIWMEKMLGAHENPPKEFIPYPEIRKENGNKAEKFSSEGIDL